MVIFIELVQYTKNLSGKSWKNLIEHPIIKNDKKKLNSIICPFFILIADIWNYEMHA